jgi:ribosome recycling factor
VIDEAMFEAEEKMEKAVNVLREDLATVRTGRASPQMFQKVVVDYYGAPTPINQLASFHVPEPRMAVITPYDKSSLNAIEKAIRDSDLGVNPTNDGNIIRVVFPQLTEERRKELVKIVRQIAEDGKIAIRNVRRDADKHLKELKTNGGVGEDDERRAEERVQKLTDDHTSRIDDLLMRKEAEITEV